MHLKNITFLTFILTVAYLASSIVYATTPIVIAHRGASGYLPEHTLEAAALAFALHADYIEQDLVLSKDGVAVVLHDIHLETVTNVEQIFPDRHREDRRFYAIDFTLSELKRLRVHERTNSKGQRVFPNRYQGEADFSIATFEEQIELIAELNRRFKKNVGIYAEIKSPAWHRAEGQDISRQVIKILRKHGLDDNKLPVYLQCFDFKETKRLRSELNVKAKLVQLIGENDWNESDSDYDYLRSESGLREISKVAQGIGPPLDRVLNVETGNLTVLVTMAKGLGLEIHPFTFRIDALPEGLSSADLLNGLFTEPGVSGVFTDFPDVTRKYFNKIK